jgi:hypothetical protein
MQLLDEQIGLVLQLATASQQQPAPFSLDVRGLIAGTSSKFRKLPAFASAAIAIGDLLTQIVQHSANNPSAQCPINKYQGSAFTPRCLCWYLNGDISQNRYRYFRPGVTE